jgi:hypothetical protein
LLGHADPEQGLRNAKHLAAQLDKSYPGAATSLREGLEEMFTVARMGIDGRLAKTLTTSNPVESMISIARTTNRLEFTVDRHPSSTRLGTCSRGTLGKPRRVGPNPPI